MTFNREFVFFSFLESAWMLNDKLHVVVLCVSECNVYLLYVLSCVNY